MIVDPPLQTVVVLELLVMITSFKETEFYCIFIDAEINTYIHTYTDEA